MAQSTGGLAGTVKDPSGAVLPGTTVALTSTQGVNPAAAVTNAQGAYQFRGLTPGSYTVTVNAPGFTLYVKRNVVIRAGQPQSLSIALAIASVSQQVQVTSDTPTVDITPDNNTSSVTISAKVMAALPDDPDELEAELLALAGPSAGPNGGQIYVDGFTVDQGLPPKSSIKEIRINQNPFSPQYDRLGYGRIEIITKPGTNQWHGRAMASGNDMAFDTTDPFAVGSPGYYSVLGSGDVSGPIGKIGSFFYDYQHRTIVNNDLVNAIVLGPGNAPTPFNQTLAAPSRLDITGPRVDFALGENNILAVTYEYYRNMDESLGIGQFSLPSQGYSLYALQNILRATDTQILGQRFVNETSYQGQDQDYVERPTTTTPKIDVIGGFTSGGDTEGYLNYHHHHNEVDDTATLSLSKHTLTFGGRLRTVTEPYVSPLNFNGTFTFPTLAAYAAGTPSQFSISVGNPLTKLFSYDVGLYVSDDWRASSRFMLSYGMRFETQNFIHDHADWGPRVGIAYGIGRKSNPSPKTVLRAGFGIFYDRFSQQLQLQVMSLNGQNQTGYVVNNPSFYPNIPTPTELSGYGAAGTVYQLDPKLHAPYIMESAVGLERQLSRSVTGSVTYLTSIGNDQLISNNINAPQPGTYNPAVPTSGVRPFPSQGNIYEYQSSAIFRQNEMIANVNVRASNGLSLFGSYTYSHANSDTAGPGSFPDNPYDISADYGRAGFDIRQRISAGGSMAMRYGIVLSPLLNFQSGPPYNVTIGQDLNGSTIFNQRPAYATASTPAGDVVTTKLGSFNVNPGPTDKLIPINVGSGPHSIVFNLRASKIFIFGRLKTGERAASTGTGPSGGGLGGNGGRGFRPGTSTQSSGGGSLGSRGLGASSGPGGSGAAAIGRYNFTVSAEARNLLNDVNLGTPVGNLTSPLFGQSNSLQGGVYSFNGTNRRIDLQVAFNF